MFFNARLFTNPTFQSLAKKGCTTTVIDLLLQVLQLAADRTRLLNHPLTESMTLLTMLRSEINVAQEVLKYMKVDLEGLEQRLDELLEQCGRDVLAAGELAEEDLAHSHREVTATIWELVEWSRQEAAALRYDYIGTEHLLLAIIRTADASLSSILADSGVTYEVAQNAILKLLHP